MLLLLVFLGQLRSSNPEKTGDIIYRIYHTTGTVNECWTMFHYLNIDSRMLGYQCVIYKPACHNNHLSYWVFLCCLIIYVKSNQVHQPLWSTERRAIPIDKTESHSRDAKEYFHNDAVDIKKTHVILTSTHDSDPVFNKAAAVSITAWCCGLRGITIVWW